ncbi:MAG: tyrosine-type recombinase/integrase [Armatimonadetes bacterium]|nr:tyrosine-type recombinase/integrase [Armatimonadota bacterium]
MDLREALSLFEDHAEKGRRLSPLTVAAYRGDALAFSAWREDRGLSLQVGDVLPPEIEAYLAACPQASSATLRRRLDALSSLYRFLVKRGLATGNPVDQVDRPRLPDNRRAHLTEAHMARLAAVVERSDEKAILLLLCLLGLRRSEVVKLDCGDIDLTGGRIEVRQSKGGHSRVLPIPSELATALQTYLRQRNGDPHAPLFVSQTGQRLSRSVLARNFSRWLADAGLEGLGLSPHSCRHGAASRWLKAGLTIIEAQALLGHRDTSTTGKYCHASLDDISAAMSEKLRPIGQQPDVATTTTAPGEWGEILGQLTPDQEAALLTLARSMVEGGSARAP